MLFKILVYIYKNLEKNDSKSFAKANDLINSLPILEELDEIVEKRMFTKADLLSIKIVLDILMFYHERYDQPTYKNYSKSLDVSMKFFKNLKNTEIEHIYDEINARELNEILLKTNAVISKDKEDYIKKINTLIDENTRLTKGLDSITFCN